MLSNAIDELKALGEQWYWNDASLTKENCYEYTLKFFKLWIENPDPKYKILRENNCNASLPKDVYKRQVETLSDTGTTRLMLVSRPEIAPLKEAARSSHELQLLGIKNQLSFLLQLDLL